MKSIPIFITFLSTLILFSSCASRTALVKENFVENCNLLKKGMRLDEVSKIMGEPISSNTQSFPGVSELGQVYHFHDNKYKSLMAVFLGDTLKTATLSEKEGKFHNTTEIVKYDPMDFMPSNRKSYNKRPMPDSKTSSKSMSYEEAKRVLIKNYLNKEISKEEYFELRRELDNNNL